MASKNLFASLRGALVPKADARNEAGGAAYSLSPDEALAQLAATGCMNGAFYATAEQQLESLLLLAMRCDAETVAKVAIYAREKGHMKDAPALLCAVLAVRSPHLLARVFDRVIDDGKMLRNFVQILRSGAVGRKSLGTRPKKLVQGFFEQRTDVQVVRASVGADPSLGDVVKMVHPKPATKSRSALYAWLCGRAFVVEDLPPEVAAFEAYKRTRDGELPDVPFQLLTSLELGTAEWMVIAERCSWQTLRQSLSTLARRGVFDVPGQPEKIAARLRDPKAVRHARVLPYQLLVTYLHAQGLPSVVRDALHDALEHATENVPSLDGEVVVCPDVSGSMASAATGVRAGATSVARCVDVAALIAASLLRRNARCEVMPFSDRLVDVRLDKRDSVLTNAHRLSAALGGGTAMSLPLDELNRRGRKPSVVVYVSDNQSWADTASRGTATLSAWEKLRARAPHAKLVCIDLQPYTTVQATPRGDVLHVGGFSDAVFEVVSQFVTAESPKAWLELIQQIAL